jgi:uncharacterized Rmd1/YagE family protein
MWGFTADEEQMLLADIKPFEEERLDVDECETEQYLLIT